MVRHPYMPQEMCAQNWHSKTLNKLKNLFTGHGNVSIIKCIGKKCHNMRVGLDKFFCSCTAADISSLIVLTRKEM